MDIVVMMKRTLRAIDRLVEGDPAAEGARLRELGVGGPRTTIGYHWTTEWD